LKEKYILGIHIGHDATAVLLNYKGEIIAAVAEERLSRVKSHTGFPYCAVEEVLKIGNIDKKDIKIIASSTKHILYPDFKVLEPRSCSPRQGFWQRWRYCKK